jgi:uncharacterized 2Fe-2S/4Fe-4S cluster protein (DUF4445 family)
LLNALAKAGVPAGGPCGGAGTCGKCKVAVFSGSSSPVTGSERALLSGSELAGHWRLACRTFPAGDLTVGFPRAESLNEKFPRDKKEDEKKDAPGRGFLSRAVSGRRAACGLAADIGTTTVDADLVDLETGAVLAERSAVNPQTRFGMDVLSRISRAMARPDSVGEMQRAIAGLLDAMTEDLCRDARSEGGNIAEPSSIRTVAVAANCVMLHLFLGVNPAPLGAFPFTPVFVRGRGLSAADAGLKSVPRDAEVYCLPSASAFIGADIVAGVYVSELARRKGRVLFIDIGTNGEIVLSREGKLVSCSCAAGPALEGMNISCGMRAAPGAVEDVFIDGAAGTVRLKVVRDMPPAGICGSGVLAAIREMLRAGLLRADGSLTEKEELPPERRNLAALRDAGGGENEGSAGAVRLAENVVVTQKDIRQVQLAKGALLSGVRALLDHAGIGARDLDKVLVAGRFGEHLPAESLTECGILPAGLGGKIEYLGNSSKAGARAALMSARARGEMETLARGIEYLDLGAAPGYGDLFIQCLEFPD